jgi:hypothetical protein
MSISEKNPKSPTESEEKDSGSTKEEEKNIDRDGRERQPNQHTNDKS